MNFLTLAPGDALFIPADGIHAYLSRDIVECMARSTNVLNAGFCTEEEKADTELFVSQLKMEGCELQDLMLEGQREAEGKVLYSPPMKEFDLVKVVLDGGKKEMVKSGEGPAVLIVTRGGGRMKGDGKDVELKEGGIWFVAPGVDVEFEGGLEELEVYVVVV